MNRSILNPTSRLLLGSLFMLVGFTGCSQETEAPVERLRPVNFVIVHAGGAALRDRVFSGAAKAGQESRLSFNVAGTVKQLPVAIGDTLQAGQLIAALDPATYEVEVQRAQASLSQADAGHRNAESEYQRVRQLYANNNASQNDLDAALSSTESAKANRQAMAQSLQLARLNSGYTRLTADSDCSVASVSIELNENVSAGTQVAVVNCGDRWEVEIAVPESIIAAFRPEMAGIVRFNAIPDRTFAGTVTEVGIAGGGSTFPVTLTLNESHSAFRSGLATEVTFTFAGNADNDNVFFLPPSAVGQDEQGAFIYVLESSDQPGVAITRRRSVVVGALSASGLEITEGLLDGDRVVTAGITAARDGLNVRVE